jgi:hypothetical protein
MAQVILETVYGEMTFVGQYQRVSDHHFFINRGLDKVFELCPKRIFRDAYTGPGSPLPRRTAIWSGDNRYPVIFTPPSMVPTYLEPAMKFQR